MTERGSYTWLTARARNALRRRTVISVSAGVTFVAALIGLVLIPRQATRTAHAVATRIEPRPDTNVVLAQHQQAATLAARADSELAAARRVAVPLPPPPDTLSPELKLERDSLNTLLVSLTAAMARAAGAPLPPSFRALAEVPAMQGSAQVRAWRDSLDQIERLRAPFAALGAGDPIYVTLTAQINELGRSIRDAAQLRQSELKARVAPLLPAPVAPLPVTPLPVAPAVDTDRFVQARNDAAAQIVAATRALDSMRRVNTRIDVDTRRSRELANIGAPPGAMLTAALVIALAAGFAVAFMSEVRHPRIAHTREAEVVAGARVLAVIRPTEIVERGRRQADVVAPPLIDVISESYRTLYLHLAATHASVPIVTVAGDSPAIVATVAANLAAVAAYEARSTLLVDVDSATSAVASVLRIVSEPGLAGVLAGRAELPSAVVSTTIGRDRPLDVLPSGVGRVGAARGDAIEQVREAFMRMERRYDLIVIAAPTSYAQLPTNTVIPVPDVVVCARLGDTRLEELRSAVKSLRGIGRYIHGIVLWDDEVPRLPPSAARHGVT